LNELVARCVKRSFRQYIQNVSSSSLSAAVAHYLNCYLSNSAKLASTSLNTSSNTANSLVQSDNNNNTTEQTINKTNKKRKKNQRKNNKLG
jgi:hypothetical protein